MKTQYIVWPLAACATFCIGAVIAKTTTAETVDDEITTLGKRANGHNPSSDLDTKKMKRKKRSKPGTSEGTSEGSLNSGAGQYVTNKSRMGYLIKKIEGASEKELRVMLVTYAQKTFPDALGVEIQLIIDALLAIAPGDTLDFIGNHKHQRISKKIFVALRALAKTEPMIASKWAHKIKGRRRDLMLSYVAQGACYSDPRLGLKIMAEMKDKDRRSSTIWTTGHHIATLPIREVWDWMKEYGPRRLSILYRHLPVDKIGEAMEILEDEPKFERHTLIRRWAEGAPDELFKWLDSVPKSDAKKHTYPLLEGIGNRAPEKLNAWIKQFRDDPSYTSAKGIAARYIKKTFKSHPELAAGELVFLEGNSRAYFRNKIFESWSKIDKGAAQRFLDADQVLHPYDKSPVDPFRPAMMPRPFNQLGSVP